MKYPCAICGKKQPAENMVYSHRHKVRYCPLTDEEGCAARKRRNERNERKRAAA